MPSRSLLMMLMPSPLGKRLAKSTPGLPHSQKKSRKSLPPDHSKLRNFHRSDASDAA
jgi:hypothetical protein